VLTQLLDDVSILFLLLLEMQKARIEGSF